MAVNVKSAKLKRVSVVCLSEPWSLEIESRLQNIKLTSDTKRDLLRWTITRLGAKKSSKGIKKLTNSGEITWNDEAEFEVEKILKHDRVEGVDYYLVEWKGWSSKDNTWEARGNLHCEDLIDDYIRLKKGCHKRKEVGTTYQNDCVKRNRMTDMILTRLDAMGASGKISATQLAESMRLSGDLNITQKTRVKFTTRKTREMELNRSLQQWQVSLMSLLGHQTPRILIENTVDMEGPPDNFEYIVDYKAGVGVFLNNDPVIGCDCQPRGCYDDGKACCAEASGHEVAYTRHRRLRVPEGTPIYECNKACTCPPACFNRVVQNGQTFKLCIFRTSNGRGWGVKSLRKIKSGSFVMEYLGEIITPEEAERRGRQYDMECRTYLFDLDYNGDENPYCVDGGYYGNISHFVNHSCEPNVTQYCVWINNLDPNLPRIAFFSNRDIARGEEITVDYKMTDLTCYATASGDSKYRMVCQCGSEKCRGYLF